MDDFVSSMISEQSNPNGLLLEMLVSGYEQWDVVVAVEGPADRIFYHDYVSQHLTGKEIHFLVCGGKDPLLGFKESAESYDWIDPPKFMYLCDKDFDDYLGKIKDGVWYTEFYSIESFVSCPDYIDFIIKKYASAPVSLGDRGAFMALFEREQMRFIKRIRAYSAYMCEVRACGEHPSFDDFGIERLFSLGADGAPATRGRSSAARRILGVKTQISFSQLLARARSFEMSEWKRWLRGKLALQVARKSYERALSLSNRKIKKSLPGPSYIGKDALDNSFPFLKDLAKLQIYCSGAIGST